jgi:molybdate transport repressor ModE-like protein
MDEADADLPILVPNYKLWLEHEGEYVFGPGAYAILKSVIETGTISQGAKELKMSYRYAWGVISKIEKKLGKKLLNRHKGGTEGGGGAEVTEFGSHLMHLYKEIDDKFVVVVQRNTPK